MADNEAVRSTLSMRVEPWVGPISQVNTRSKNTYIKTHVSLRLLQRRLTLHSSPSPYPSSDLLPDSLIYSGVLHTILHTPWE